MSNWGGFDHNAHTLKIVTKLEENYGNFNGLNLSFETLEGIVKHNGPLIGANISPLIAGYNKLHNLDLSNWPSLEAQVVSLCDDIAYNSHDIEDGVKAGLISIDGISSIAFVRDIVHQVKSIHGNLIKRRLVHEVARRITNLMVQDLVSQTKKNLVEYNIKTAQDVRNSKTPIAGFSQEMEEVVRQIKSYLLANMYRHYKINKMTNRAMRIIKELYEVFEQDNSCLPAKWYKKTLKVSPQKQAIIISDFIAGMTDRFAIKEHAFFLGVTQ
jgi:dGTPase